MKTRKNPRSRNLSRLRANAAIAPNTRMANTETVVTIMLLMTYLPSPPSCQARPRMDRSMDFGSAQGLAKISSCFLKDESTIQTSGSR